MSRRRVSLFVAVLVLTPSPTEADVFEPNTGDILHIQSPLTGKTDGGTDLRLPPGYFLDEPTFKAKDAELRTLQEDKTRRDAENLSLKETAKSWQPGWKLLAVTLVTGIAGGVYIRSKFD